MVEYRASSTTISSNKPKSGVGRLVGIVALFVALLASLLFVSGFWNPRPSDAALPLAQASAGTGQQASAVPVSNDSLAGTMKLPVDPPPTRKSPD